MALLIYANDSEHQKNYPSCSVIVYGESSLGSTEEATKTAKWVWDAVWIQEQIHMDDTCEGISLPLASGFCGSKW